MVGFRLALRGDVGRLAKLEGVLGELAAYEARGESPPTDLLRRLLELGGGASALSEVLDIVDELNKGGARSGDELGRLHERLYALTGVDVRGAERTAIAAAGEGESEKAGAGPPLARGKAKGTREPLAFVVWKPYWDNNVWQVQGFFHYVKGYYGLIHGVKVDLVLVRPTTILRGEAAHIGCKYHAAVTVMGHGAMVYGDFLVQGTFWGADLWAFLDMILVPGRKGVVAHECFAGHGSAKAEAEAALNTVIKGGDLMGKDVASAIKIEGHWKCAPTAAGFSMFEHLQELYGFTGTPGAVGYDPKEGVYEVWPYIRR